MSEQIRSLADRIRDQLRAEQSPAAGAAAPDDTGRVEAGSIPAGQAGNADVENLAARYPQAERFFRQLSQFDYSATQKSVIRVDSATLQLLRRLKLVSGLEMNRVIVFALHQLLAKNPWLADYIKESLNNPDL